MAMRVAMVLVGSVDVWTVVMMTTGAVGRYHLDASGRNSRPHDAGVREKVIDAERAQRGPQRFDRHACVHERAEQHVARCARKTLDVHHPRHGPSLDSLMEQYSTSARTR